MLETKSAPFTFVKQGIFYFSRRVPSDLSHHYNASRIMYSLRTRSAAVATSRAQRAAQQLDEHWYHLRIRDVDLPGKHLLRMDGQPAATGHIPGADASGGSVTLSEAVSIYTRLKGKDLPRQADEEPHAHADHCTGEPQLPRQGSGLHRGLRRGVQEPAEGARHL